MTKIFNKMIWVAFMNILFVPVYAIMAYAKIFNEKTYAISILIIIIYSEIMDYINRKKDKKNGTRTNYSDYFTVRLDGDCLKMGHIDSIDKK